MEGDEKTPEESSDDATTDAGDDVSATDTPKSPHNKKHVDPPSNSLITDTIKDSISDAKLFIPALTNHSKIQATPTSPSATPTIPLATPATPESPPSVITNSFSNSITTRLSRLISLDPYLTQPIFKRAMYSRPSIVQRLSLERRLKEHAGCVNCINFSWSGRLLASGSDDLQVVLWDWAKGKVVGKFDSGHVANVFQAKFMPHCEDSVIVTAARDGQVICDIITSTGDLHHSKRVGHHNDSAHKLALEPTSPHVFLSCGEDGTVLQIDLREDNATRNKILVCKNEKNRRVSLYSIFIDPSNQNHFAVSGRDQWARIYDIRQLKEASSSQQYEVVKRYCPHHLMTPENELKRANITCLVYSHNGKQLLCSYNDEDIYLFDTTHSTEADHIHKYSGHRNSATVKGVNFFGLESEYVTSGSDCGNVFLWDKETEKIVQYMEGDHEGVVNCLEPHPHIPILATSGLDHDIKLFSPTAAKPTDLNGLSEVTERNRSNREDSWNSPPSDGYELIMEFIMQQYRRGLQERVGVPPADSDDDSFLDTPPNESGDDNEDEDDEDEREGERRLRRCIHQ